MTAIDRRDFLARLGCCTLAAALPAGRVEATQPRRANVRPNIVLIMTDDLGYGDLGITGRREYRTDAIDGIARRGALMTQAYSAAPVCSPTRVALLTGRYPARVRAGLHEPLTSQPEGLAPAPATLPRLLRDAGYHTALVGKWHLGTSPEFHPLRHGFHEFYGFLGAAADYASHRDTEQRRPLFMDGERPVTDPGYLTELFTARAVRIVEAARMQPLFLSLQYNAPHWPWQGPGDAAYPDSGSHQAGGSPETFARMMTSLDAGVGAVLAAIARRGLARDTLVIFTSDNGGERFSHMGPYSAGKMTLNEGGIRVATAASWPGVIPAGSTCAQVTTTMDWTATVLALAGARPVEAPDGIDLLPALSQRSRPVARELGWRITQRREQRALRLGDWKYLRTADGEFLYDLARDPGEKSDLRATRPREFEAARSAFARWEGAMLPPVPLEARFR